MSLSNESAIEGIQMMLGIKPLPTGVPVREHEHVSDGHEYARTRTEATYFCTECKQHYQIKLRDGNFL